MEKHPPRESILLGWSPQISFGNSASSSPRGSVGNSDIDYNDVFGGPPRRRSSINDSCYSLNETADSFPTKQDAEPVTSRNLWSGLSEKPVFGEEPAYARRHPGGFFDDIFKGEESGASTPKRHDREPFSPMSSSLGLSPFRSLPPMAETFESPSLTAKFSLPARVARGIDVSALDSAADSTNKFRDAGISGANHSYSPSLPTFSTLSSQVPEDAKHDIHSVYWSSLSSQESCQNREEPSLQEKTDGTNIGNNLEKVFKSTEDSTSQSQFPFHFSIYKWANKEVSFAMPPTRGHVPRLKQTAKTRRCSSSNGRMVTEMSATQSPTSTLSDSDRLSSDHSLKSKDSFKLRPEKEESDSTLEETNQLSKKRPQIVKEPILPKPQLEKTSSLHKTADRALLHHSRREAKYAGGYGLEEQNQYEQKPSQIVEEPILSKSESEKAGCVQETVDCAPTSTLSDSDRLSSDHSLKSKDSFKLRPEKEESDSILEETNQQSKKRPPIVKEPILAKPQPEKMSSLHKTADRALLHRSRREAKYAGGYGLEEQNQYEQKPSQIVEEPILSKSESEKASSVQETVDCAPLKHSKREEKVNSFIVIGVPEKTEKVLPEFTKEAVKHESRSACSIVDDNKAKGAKETLTFDDGDEIKVKSNRISPLSFDSNKILKKEDGEATIVRKTEVEKSSSQSSSSNSRLSADGQRVGKVKEFVKIFNQELSSTSKADMDNHNPSSKQKHGGNSEANIEVCTTKTDLKVPLQNLNNTVAPVSVKVDELYKQSSDEQPASKTDSHGYNTAYSEQNSPAESVPEDSKFTVVDIDETFQENFLIKELPPDEIKQPQMQNDREELKAIDDKIRQWSRGKEGNIRSLLSTLQYVLWPESGWKPVPLVDIINGNAVKRSYQRALLCLHPDKLQQRGVTSQQKYTAEKVFDILQEAWTLFSSLGLS